MKEVLESRRKSGEKVTYLVRDSSIKPLIETGTKGNMRSVAHMNEIIVAANEFICPGEEQRMKLIFLG